MTLQTPGDKLMMNRRKVLIGTAVIANGPAKTEFVVLNRVPVVRETAERNLSRIIAALDQPAWLRQASALLIKGPMKRIPCVLSVDATDLDDLEVTKHGDLPWYIEHVAIDPDGDRALCSLGPYGLAIVDLR